MGKLKKLIGRLTLPKNAVTAIGRVYVPAKSSPESKIHFKLFGVNLRKYHYRQIKQSNITGRWVKVDSWYCSHDKLPEFSL